MHKSDKIYYFGLLGNVNYSIQFINFDDALTVEKWHKSKIVGFIADMVDRPTYEIEERFETIYGCGDKKSAYFLSGEVKDLPRKSKRETDGAFIWKTQQYYEALIQNVENKIALLRLCSKGDIKLSFSCFYTFDAQGKRELDASFDSDRELRNWKFYVSNNEIDYFNEFISKTSVPLSQEYLQLAFENFLLSYDVHDDRLSFLSLMIALETLFNDGTQELSYRVSRGAAVFLGRTKRESETIFHDVKKLYAKRSTLVHTGDPKNISKSDLFLLQNYVRNSLRLLIQCDMPKKVLTARLTMEAFGALNRIKKISRL